MTALDEIVGMLQNLGEKSGRLPASYLYNEGWMLRLILKAASEGDLSDFIQPFKEDEWYSEAKLATPFDRSRGKAGEGPTSVDGIVGDFEWRTGTQTGVSLLPSAKRFEIFEAKMFSKLSTGVTAARWYDQAVRTVACMAHTLSLANLSPEDIDQISFRVIAPESQIEQGVFASEINPDSMRLKMQRRINQFHGTERELLEYWQENSFAPLLKRLERDEGIKCLSWDELIGAVTDESRKKGIRCFYNRCFKLGQKEKQISSGDLPEVGRLYRMLDKAERNAVVVCKVGPVRSRVYRPESEKESFLVENGRIEAVKEATQRFPAPPRLGEERVWKGQRVRVVSNGACRSKVEEIDFPGPVRIVDNHLLKPMKITE
ncbi:MAG: hypothetical protein CMJ47_06510 [Planctomyces sp.]|nr:hypothetical protein [Planctomyces sp.]